MEINFSEKIKEYREIKFLTQQELADILGLHLFLCAGGKQKNMSQL